MSRFFCAFFALGVTICGISALAGCSSESSAVDQPDGGLPGDGGVDAGGGGSGGLPDGGGGGSGAGGVDGFHPAGYAQPDVHGFDLRQSVLDCRSCHGDDLTGSLGPSCDTCHSENWRTDCVFCHGGVEDKISGAPPKNLDGTLTSAEGAFAPHHAHVATTLTESLDCVECHVQATDVLSVGHVFDIAPVTPGMAEVDLRGGRSRLGTYDATTGCASLYCHGNGQDDNGNILVTAAEMTCTSCHAGMVYSESAWESMSGEHSKHLKESFDCGECHADVTSDGLTIAMPSLHVNGQPDLQFFEDGFTYDPGSQSCSGSCHGENHNNDGW